MENSGVRLCIMRIGIVLAREVRPAMLRIVLAREVRQVRFHVLIIVLATEVRQAKKVFRV